MRIISLIHVSMRHWKWCIMAVALAFPGFCWGSASLVSITVNPSFPTLPVGVSLQLQAVGNYSDGSTQDITRSVIWSSSNTPVATISNSSGTYGVVATKAIGSAAIKATQGSIAGNTTLRVKTLSSLSVSPVNKTLPQNSSTQYFAVGTFTDGTKAFITSSVTWSSSSSTVATVSNSPGTQGVVTGVGVGTATVKAQVASISGSTAVFIKVLKALAIYPAGPWIPVGGKMNLVAGATYTDGTFQAATSSVKWASSAPGVATVGSALNTSGLVTAMAVGTTKITISVGSISGSTTITVKSPTSIAVTPGSPLRGNGMQLQFTATAAYTDGSHQDVTTFVNWNSGTPTVATISAQGVAQAITSGQSRIGALINGIQGSTTLTVKTFSSIVVSPTSASLASGQQSYTATARYTDGTQQNITSLVNWTTSSPQVASVSNGPAKQGIATALSKGTATIAAHAGSETGSATLNVTSTTLGHIRHIIFFLQENRSFDTYFGRMPQYRVNKGIIDNPPVEGLPSGVSLPGKLGDMVAPYPFQTVCHENDAAGWDPSHLDVDGGKMDRFLLDAPASTIDSDGTWPVGYYDWNYLPYYYELGFQFAISDEFFSSVLGPTIPNRMYMFAATSSGNIQDGVSPPPGGITTPTIFDALDRAAISWRMYYQDTNHLLLKAYSTWNKDSGKVVPWTNWQTDIANEGTLPQVIFIERGGGYDEHPGANVEVGSNRVASIINALIASPSWPYSVFIEAFDEGGGTYDHVPPKSVPAPDGTAPILASGDQPGSFTITGFRVPLMVVSPWIKPHLVSHTPRELTSILKLIETRFNVPALTLRDSNADNMTEFFDFSSAHVLSVPKLPPQPTTATCSYTVEPAPGH